MGCQGFTFQSRKDSHKLQTLEQQLEGNECNAKGDNPVLAVPIFHIIVATFKEGLLMFGTTKTDADSYNLLNKGTTYLGQNPLLKFIESHFTGLDVTISSWRNLQIFFH